MVVFYIVVCGQYNISTINVLKERKNRNCVRDCAEFNIQLIITKTKI